MFGTWIFSGGGHSEDSRLAGEGVDYLSPGCAKVKQNDLMSFVFGKKKHTQIWKQIRITIQIMQPIKNDRVWFLLFKTCCFGVHSITISRPKMECAPGFWVGVLISGPCPNWIQNIVFFSGFFFHINLCCAKQQNNLIWRFGSIDLGTTHEIVYFLQ